MSLQQISERVYVYRGGVNFTILVGEQKRLVLVDSGLDSHAPRKALRPFLEDGYTLGAIINTHSHADHIGGNADLVKRTGCQVWAPAKEAAFIRWPELEPVGLYGAWPPPTLQVKFLQAQATPEVRELPPAPATFTLEGLSLELIPVPGHALDQVAIAVDGVLIAADGLFRPEMIERHPIIFLVNVAEYLSGLDRIGAREERLIIPGHGDLIDRTVEEGDPLPAIIAANQAAMARMQEAILAALADGPLEGDELLFRVAQLLGKVHESEPQFYLDRAAVAAHLSYLRHQGQLQGGLVNGRMQFAR